MRVFYGNWEPAGYWRYRRVQSAVQSGAGEIVTVREAVLAGCEVLISDVEAAAHEVARKMPGAGAWALMKRSARVVCLIQGWGVPAEVCDLANRLLNEEILHLAHDAADEGIRARGAAATVRRGRQRDGMATVLDSLDLAQADELAAFVRCGTPTQTDPETLYRYRRDEPWLTGDERSLAIEAAGGGSVVRSGSRSGAGGGKQGEHSGQVRDALQRGL